MHEASVFLIYDIIKFVTTPQIERHLTANMNLKKRRIILYNFLGGLAWGFGTVVGATVVVTILAWILSALGVFSFVSDFFPKR